jgi:septal ring factor EnvC (AmiA/AmiB activator)
MKKFLLTIIILASVFHAAAAQTRKELEEQREKTLQEISYVDNLLKETSKERKESLNELNMISKKLNLRNRL